MRYSIIIYLILISNLVHSQVYNYSPISKNNIESNPSYVASGKSNLLLNATHINSFNKDNKFSLNTIQISKYFYSYFSGIGLTVSNTNTGDSIKYNHIGLSLAYRNILLDKVYVKLGANYKVIYNTSPIGFYKKYSFISNDSIMNNSVSQNINFALTLSTSKELFYTTFGLLNISPSWTNTDNILFPKYSYVKIGNFWNIFEAYTSKELSLLLINEYMKSNEYNLGYYITFYNRLYISRNKYIKYGGDIGYNDNYGLNIRPSVLFFIRTNGFIIFRLSTDLAYKISYENKEYKPAYIFSIMYNLK